MNMAMEVHDSWLNKLEIHSDGTGFALVRGVVYRSNGLHFGDAKESGWQDIRFDFESVRIEGKVPELPAYASGGELWVNGKNTNGVFALPANHFGTLCLEMRLSDEFELLKIHASRITTSFTGEFELEAVWDVNGNRT